MTNLKLSGGGEGVLAEGGFSSSRDLSPAGGGSLPVAKSKAATWSVAHRRKLAKLLSAGLTFAQAAERLGVHRGSVCWATARYGIGRPAANLSRATGARKGRPPMWSDEALTEKWADRRKVA